MCAILLAVWKKRGPTQCARILTQCTLKLMQEDKSEVTVKLVAQNVDDDFVSRRFGRRARTTLSTPANGTSLMNLDSENGRCHWRIVKRCMYVVPSQMQGREIVKWRERRATFDECCNH